jgi:16S rRNA (cytosine967-C5)-methyltransferase
MISPARKLSYKLLCRIDSGSSFSDDALNSEVMERLEGRDRNLTTEIVYGSLRWQGALDHILAGVSARPWQTVEPEARTLLRMSVYQMWQMDRIPDHALVNDGVELAKRELGKGIDKYVNGILRKLVRTRPWTEDGFWLKAPRWARASLPQWLWDRWAGRYGETAAMEFALSLNRPPLPAFRSTAGRPESLSAEAVLSDLVPGAAIRTSDISEQDRRFGYQDEASQLVPYLLGSPARGSRVWDACAAPGGKTAVLCGLYGETGQVVASDVSRTRMARLRHLFENEEVSVPAMVVADASKTPPFRCRFDAVLADVPCSGLGTLRRNPEIKWRFRPEDFGALQKTQGEILAAVAGAVRIGGYLLYSTCSTEPEENEDVIKSFLSAHSEFRLETPVEPHGVDNWISHDGMLRTFPGSRLWDGFFAALMLRRS